MGLRIVGNNLVQRRFDNVEINYLNLSLTGILKLNFVAYFLLREKFETTPKSLKHQMCDVTFSPKSWGNCYVTVQDSQTHIVSNLGLGRRLIETMCVLHEQRL